MLRPVRSLALDLGSGYRGALSHRTASRVGLSAWASSPVIWLAVALVVARFVPAVLFHEPWIVPDESTFLEGGAAWSPLVGPIAGALGVAGFLTFNAAVGVVLVLVAAALAHEWGGEPERAAIVVAVSPALFWGLFVMPDLVGALGIVAWALAITRGRPWTAALLLVLAIGADVTFSFIAFGWVVAALVLRSPLLPALAAFAGSAAVALALLRLGGYVELENDGSLAIYLAKAIAWGTLAVALVLLPLIPAFLYGLRFPRSACVPLLAAGAGIFLAAGYVGAVSGFHANARYGLPLAVLVLCGLSRGGYRASTRVVVWGCLLILGLGIATPADESEALWMAAALSPVGYALALLLGGILGSRGRPALGLALQSAALVAVDLAISDDIRAGLSLATVGVRW
jgi:hypothetical protein